jgi:hypothetical protein
MTALDTMRLFDCFGSLSDLGSSSTAAARAFGSYLHFFHVAVSTHLFAARLVSIPFPSRLNPTLPHPYPQQGQTNPQSLPGKQSP